MVEGLDSRTPWPISKDGKRLRAALAVKNSDVIDSGEAITQFQRDYSGIPIPYARD